MRITFFILPLKVLLAIACGIGLWGCSSVPSVSERKSLADNLAAQRGWHPLELHAETFELKAYVPASFISTSVLTIYMEGDGLAWIASDMPSSDPTPVQPVALRMALSQPDGDAAYLARPCQYTGPNARNCSRTYWTGKRFAPDVVESMNAAVSMLKQRAGARTVQLVGYSGGAAIALLIAARRPDVARVVTAAGNLDTDAWTTYHRITPLAGSINPALEHERLRTVSQLHLSGARDSTVPPQIARSYAAHFAPNERPITKILEDYDHRCCWAENWRTIWQQYLATESP